VNFEINFVINVVNSFDSIRIIAGVEKLKKKFYFVVIAMS